MWIYLDPSYAFVSFDELLKESDFLVVAANATKENYQVFDIEAFCRMKTESIFINVGRLDFKKSSSSLVRFLSSFNPQKKVNLYSSIWTWLFFCIYIG